MASRSLLKSTLLYLPAQLAAPFVQFVVVVTWTHLLDPASFGVVTFVVAAQELAGMVGLMWWTLYILRFQRRFSEFEGDRFRAMDRRMVAIASACQIVVAPICLYAIGIEPDLATAGACAAYFVSRTTFAHYSDWARSNHRITAYSLAQVSGPILGSGLSVLAALLFGPSPAVVLTAMAIGQGVGAVGLVIALKLGVGFGKFDPAIFRDARRYGAPLIFSGLFAWAAVNGVRLIVQEVDGVIGVGLFSAGWGLGQRITNVIAMLCTAAAFPIAVDRMESGDKAGALRQTALNGALMFALLAPAAVGVCVLAKPIVDLLIAEEYRAITTVTLPIAVIVGGLRAFKTHTADQAYLLVDKTKANLASSVVDAILAIVGAFVGVMAGKIAGAAAGSLIAMIFAASLSVGYAARRFGLPIDLSVYLRIVASAAIMGAVLTQLPVVQSYFALGAAIAVGAAVYFIVALALFPQIRTEILERWRQRAARR